jgi:MarR family 2-MHQ and catechol resistance regulon transcriptional repressor
MWKLWQQMGIPIRLFLTLYKTDATLVRGLEERLAPLGLTLGRLCLLVLLQQAGEPMLPSELGDDLAVTRANVSGLLKGLEAAGLVRREVDVTNRRQTLVHLTEAGSSLLAQAWPIYEETVTGGLKALTPDEQETLLALLQKVIAR